ncbi:MAG: hypothetical protein AB7I27_15030 [Bacteriovoracaceae bacterium]
MEQVKWNYFQYRKQYDYPVFVRFKQDDLSSKFLHLLSEIGFNELNDKEVKKIQLHRTHTKILTIQGASARLEQQINGSELLDKYGPESLSLQSGMPVYTYRKVGVMGLPVNRTLWDLALQHNISHTDQMVGLRVIFVRYISQALADLGILCYWGTVKDDTVIVMKQLQSFGEAVLIDVNKKVIFSNGGEMKFQSSLKIIRKDKDSKVNTSMNREEVISFLSVNTCLLSFSGLSPAMKKAIYELSTYATASYAISETAVNL